MSQYIAFLRGINVGGHRPLKMEELREMLGQMGFENVTTYIQSGNVVFEASEEDADLLSTQIEIQIKERFGHDVPVFITKPAVLTEVLTAFPFEEKEGWKGYISFLASKPLSDQVEELEALSSQIEKFLVRDTVLFSIVNKQTDKKTLFSNSFVENRLGVPATTRNLRTINKILDIASSN